MASDDVATEGVRSFRLGRTGLQRVLGELEAPIMEVIWNRSGDASVREVIDALGLDHNYKTVMTVLNRLVSKGLLYRRRISRAFLYSAVETRCEFLDKVSRGVATALVRDFGVPAIAQFVEVVEEVVPEELSTLRDLVRRQQGKDMVGKTGHRPPSGT